MYEITKGVVSSAQKVVIYGPEGIGKSTFASQFPDPLFIDTEGSTKKLNVSRFPKPTSWEMLLNMAREVMNEKPCKTLVIDTIDWAEQLCIVSICAQYQKKGIEDFGYGKGYVYEREEFGKLLNLLQEVVDSGINVVLTAHAQLKKFEQPDEMGSYDRWELKLGQKTGSQISPLVKEWADMVLFANYKTIAVAADKDGKKFKAQGGQRVMYTSHHPCWDAKNRDSLAPELPFEYTQVAHLFAYSEDTSQLPSAPAAENITVSQNAAPQTEQVVEVPADLSDFEDVTPPRPLNIPNDLPASLKDLMAANKVDESDIRLAVSQKGYFPYDMPVANYPPDFIGGVLIGAWEQVYAMIKDNQKVPF